MREQDFLCLRKEQPGLAEAQDDCSPLVGLQPKGQVSVLCNLGLAEQTLQLRTLVALLVLLVSRPLLIKMSDSH